VEGEPILYVTFHSIGRNMRRQIKHFCKFIVSFTPSNSGCFDTLASYFYFSSLKGDGEIFRGVAAGRVSEIEAFLCRADATEAAA